MHKTTLLALTLPLFLAACTTPETGPDPLTLNFTATGTLQNYTPDQTYALSVPLATGTASVGEIKTDKAVSVTLTPEIAKAKSRTLADFVNSIKTAGCDASQLTVQDTTYRGLSKFDFTTSNGTASYVQARSEISNADGTRSVTEKAFWYATAAGSITGQYTCPGGTPITYNVTLQPGWNVIDTTGVYNPTSKTTSSIRYTSMASTNTYTGPWYAYTKN
ncbi:hypothetical protein Dxin01_02449 [Deinococcus xinjiangensis]|uniref:Lipoprotein n=1 Tax=Deinococcus xinjiangensis TaxID=457454 RepID=A0ABP9VDU3_9DEIO